MAMRCGRKRIARLAAVTAVSLAGLGLTAAPALAGGGGLETELAALANKERGPRGIAALSRHPQLSANARAYARELATTGRLSHQTLPIVIGRLQIYAENVGFSPSVAELHAAWMSSAGHRRNILGSTYTTIGVGVVSSGGVLYAVEVFGFEEKPSARPAETSSGGTAAPAPPPAGHSGGTIGGTRGARAVARPASPQSGAAESRRGATSPGMRREASRLGVITPVGISAASPSGSRPVSPAFDVLAGVAAFAFLAAAGMLGFVLMRRRGEA